MSTTRSPRRTARAGAAGAVAVALLAGGVLAAGPADAKAGRVEKRGACSPSGSWKLKAGPENGKIEIEYEVEARSGQRWKVVIKDNGITRVNTTKKTVAGVFHVRKVVTNLKGTDVISAKATNLVTGATCSGSVRF
ncbi:MAG: hypothetical protein HY830_14500 [Actinobacteria bacterium]|nr:hypothetical protein [Actinomycetota bacterium]